jgi:DNA-binding Lrp family transcriptional regulator
MNEKDQKILKILEENSRLGIQKIAKKAGMPVTTAYNRLKNLEKAGIIDKYTIKYNNAKLGRTTSAYILITLNNKTMKETKLSEHDLAKKLTAHDLVEEANLITGMHDIMLKVRTQSTDDLNRFILQTLRSIECIEKTYTLVVIEEN